MSSSLPVAKSVVPNPLQRQEQVYAQADSVYVVLPDEGTLASERREHRRRNRGCCICTFVCIALFVIIFLFVQREPTSWLVEVSFTKVSNNTYTAAGKFGFENRYCQYGYIPSEMLPNLATRCVKITTLDIHHLPRFAS
jgi:hypothetical protein